MSQSEAFTPESLGGIEIQDTIMNIQNLLAFLRNLKENEALKSPPELLQR